MGDSSEAEPAGREVADRGLTVGEIKQERDGVPRCGKGNRKRNRGERQQAAMHGKITNRKGKETFQIHGKLMGPSKEARSIQQPFKKAEYP